MEIIREAHCTVRRGLGPGTADTIVTIALDDIEPSTPAEIINDMVVREIEWQLKQRDSVLISINEIYNA